jgi:hypothetical protein
LSLELPNGYTKVDTLEYQMADPDGALLGDGFSDIKESKFYKENVNLGKYKVISNKPLEKTVKFLE